MKGVLGSCVNPACQYFQTPSAKASLKCAKCKTARYCDRNCQRAHWSYHKQFCGIWAQTSADQSEIPLAKVKQKMSELVWLIRGIPSVTDFLFATCLEEKRQGRRGCMDFEFKTFEDLYEAVRVLESQPVTKAVPFFASPDSPSYRPPGSNPDIIKLRKIVQDDLVTKVVGSKCAWIENSTRVNLQMALDLVAKRDDMMVLSVTVLLKGTYATHTHDFLYKDLSYRPSSYGESSGQ
ncbi:hypothetical protein PILCRDRAFT_61053 [Piloderma croceum F 1598]|uniref:MYND-type domain-containing protein n=1 Tax=Piloderma croceum (strain F 1598) TaxID=765440 RepID=A0A0C3BRB4_PILCF|nr:hypothetical protein PILCRDRAFT_61053 [Piloderma croceum F 1598]